MGHVAIVQIVCQVVGLIVSICLVANTLRQPAATSYHDHRERPEESSGEGNEDKGSVDASRRQARSLDRVANGPTLEELQAGDRDIDRERWREIEREAETSTDHDQPLQRICHFTHPDHELEELQVSSSVNYTSSTLVCHICRNDIVGQAYRCISGSGACNFALHRVCAQDPVSLSVCMHCMAQEMSSRVMVAGRGRASGSTSMTTFAHAYHDVVKVFNNDVGICKHCNSDVIGERFKCFTCNIDLHPVCAKNPTRLFSFMHPQCQLNLKTKPRAMCAICCEHSSPVCRIYACDQCEFYVHPSCSQLPLYLLHELHPTRNPPHPLQLRLMSYGSPCNAGCERRCQGWCYHCRICDVSFHVECILKHSISNQIPQNPGLLQMLERGNPASGTQHSNHELGMSSTGWNVDLQMLIHIGNTLAHMANAGVEVYNTVTR